MPQQKKLWVVVITVIFVMNSTMGSSLPSMAVPAIARDFGVTSQEQLVLPISVYLIGYVFGPPIWGPLSEQVGRRNLSIASCGLFTIFAMACAVAPNWPALLVFRFFCGALASAPIAIVAGILADIFSDPRTRGRAFAIFMVSTVFGPLLAPIVSGYTTPAIGWRPTFWIGFGYAGFSFICVVFLPETYGPILLSRRAKEMRRQDPSANVISPRDLEETDLTQLLTVVLARPLRMIASELIVSTTCAYIALVYAIFYMYFEAYPIVFQDLYGLSPGMAGCAYLPIGLGGLMGLPIFWCWDNYLRAAVERGATWTKREEYRRLPLACIGGPMFVVSLFWLGFSARPSVSYIAPMFAGVPFGLGFMLIFMAMLNYLTDAYEIFAASANAAASMCRSLLAVVLPLATSRMFGRLGISGACALLGGLSAAMSVIPLLFIWKGPDIRSRSRFCIALRERREEMARKTEEERQRREAVTREEKKEDEV